MTSIGKDECDHFNFARMAAYSRRQLFRGLGVCVALPAFESLCFPARFAAAAKETKKLATTPTGAPLRTAFIYFPNGAIPKAWWPTGEGAKFELKRTLTPLEPHKHAIQVLGGLNHRTAAGGTGRPGRPRPRRWYIPDRSSTEEECDEHPRRSLDRSGDGASGRSPDAIPLAGTGTDAVHKTGACDSGYSCAYQYNMSWSSPTTPMTPETNPRLVFERLFGSGRPASDRRTWSDVAANNGPSSILS